MLLVHVLRSSDRIINDIGKNVRSLFLFRFLFRKLKPINGVHLTAARQIQMPINRTRTDHKGIHDQISSVVPFCNMLRFCLEKVMRGSLVLRKRKFGMKSKVSMKVKISPGIEMKRSKETCVE